MELLVLAFLWPFLILLLGLVFVSLNEINVVFTAAAFVLFLILLGSLREKEQGGLVKPEDSAAQLERMRRTVVIFSIAILLPIFMRYVLDITDKALPAVVGGLVFGFGLVIWGIFIRNHRVLTYANVIGGAFIIIYLYMELWSLGELPRIIAAAAGLIMAVIVSVLKLKDKTS